MELSEIADLGTALAAIANLGLVGFAGYQIYGLREQIRVSKEAVETAQAATKAAEQSVEEARRARVDEQAPRVITILEDPEWPPYFDRNRSGMPGADGPRLLSNESRRSSTVLDHTHEFYFPQDRSTFLWFITRGILINEGRTTARVRIEGEGQFIDGESPLYSDLHIEVPPIAGSTTSPSGLHGQRLLQPGKVALFEWAIGMPLKHWTENNYSGPAPRKSSNIRIFDSMEYGTDDTTTITLTGRPIRPIKGRESAWQMNRYKDIQAVAMPTQRTYGRD
ncbi:hypothetical protein HNR06_000269 [Nocardiopsis arvandica]|uniref:Uncharacterized protein n=1 Tax=Nocardiopsis sinuspersici TaxID=501010 RepID=A0A7Y9X9I5_9ACTN|nr:hypothetical protein [Nocardiopsis sinuspersici]NYH50680.1 hypothetical protein [Nocardiopsis sinuspersici]